MTTADTPLASRLPPPLQVFAELQQKDNKELGYLAQP